jgi:hypothetical protein
MKTCLWPYCNTQIADTLYFCKTKQCRSNREMAGKRGLKHDEYTAWGIWADAQKERQRAKNESSAGRERTQRYRKSERFREMDRARLRAAYAPIKELNDRIRDARRRADDDWVTSHNSDWYNQQLAKAKQEATPELLELIEEQQKDMRRNVLWKEKNALSLDEVVGYYSHGGHYTRYETLTERDMPL